MAGDVGVREQVILAPEGQPEPSAALAAVAGGTVHQYGARLLIAEVAEEVEGEVDRFARETLHARVAGEGRALAADRGGLDEAEALGLGAFELRGSAEFAQAKANRLHAEQPWDEAGVRPPDAPAGVAEEETAFAPAAGAAATSARLTGRVAVGVIIVEGPDDLAFTQAERTKVVAEVQNGLTWLGAQSSPAGITWVYDIRVISLTVNPGKDSDSFSQKEALWRDPAMAKMGYGSGLAGVQSYIEDLRKAKGTDWSYCAFFTKYPLGWFAYASIGGPRLVMAYDNDGWGPDNIDRVYAHETGHIFGAPDEYAASNCNCGGQWGYFKVANGNCETCASGGGVACIMKANSWEMCAFTPYHLGFPQGARYTGVFTAGGGAHALWTNADWRSFVAKWQELSGQGLRLTDFDVTQFGGNLRYSGVFRQGSGGYGLWALATWQTFIDKWQQWSAQGLRLIDFEVTSVAGQLRYSGVFEQGTGGYGLWALADWQNFVAKWQQWSSQGMRLVNFEVTPVAGQLRYSGVFRQGTGSYGLWALADWQNFVAKWQQWSSQGMRLIDIERTQVGNELRYSGVFRQGTGPYGLWVNASWASFREKWLAWSQQGMRLIDFEVHPTGIEVTAAPEPAGAEPVAELAAMLGFAETPLPADGADADRSAGFGELMLAEAHEGAADVGLGAGGAAVDGDSTVPTADIVAAIENGHGFGQLAAPAAQAQPQPAAAAQGMGGVSVEGASARPAGAEHVSNLDAHSGTGAGARVDGGDDELSSAGMGARQDG